MNTFVRTVILAGGAFSLACASTNKADRSPSAQATPIDKKGVKLIQIVKLEQEQRALLMLEDTEQRKFSVAECLAPKMNDTVVIQRGATCTLISDQMIPDDPRLRANFDQAFTEAVREENKILRKKWRLKNSLGYAALGMGTAVGSFKLLENLVVRYETGPRSGMQIFMPRNGVAVLPRVFALGAALSVGAVVVAMLEAADYNDRVEATIEADLLRNAPGLAKDDLKQVSLETYAAIRRALISALSYQPST